MAQHRKLSLQEVETHLSELTPESKEQQADLLRTLVVVDKFLVKHDQTPLARQLRRSVRRLMT